MAHPPPSRSNIERIAFICWLTFFGLFALNVIAGKWSAQSDQTIWHLERVPEFLLLFASAISFAVASLAAERRHNKTKQPSSHEG